MTQTNKLFKAELPKENFWIKFVSASGFEGSPKHFPDKAIWSELKSSRIFRMNM